jgi:hypothetical protein
LENSHPPATLTRSEGWSSPLRVVFFASGWARATPIFVPSSDHRPTAPLPPHTELQVAVAIRRGSFAALQLSRFQSFSAHRGSEQRNKFANELTNWSQSTKCFVEINEVHRVASTTQRVILSDSRPHLIWAQLSQLAEPYRPVTLPPPHICPAQTPLPTSPRRFRWFADTSHIAQ